jgi:hypothetical protein
MVRLALSVLLSLAAGTSLAQRPSTQAMSCGQARSLVASQGAVVMSTGAHTYDRFVAAPNFCMLGEYAYYAYAPTSDARSCRLGFVCKPGRPLFDDYDDDMGGLLRDR